MLVLHGFWSNSGGMRLWAEDSDLLVKSPSQALRSARPHPFAAPADLIAGIHPGKPATAVLLLPSLRSAPLDSPELIRLAPRPAARTDPMLLAWTVPVVDLDPTAALAAFDQPAPDVRYGASVDYLAELAVFARELVERGRVLPQLRRDTHGAAACWRPVLQGRDVVAMTSLVSAMPPVCRAEVGGHDPHELATSALDAMVDAAVRAALSPMDLLPPRRGRSKRHRAVEAWLTALTCPDGRFDAEPDELDALAEALRPWDDVGIGTVGPARATFRLSEVETENEETPAGSLWRLEFLLQSTQDPSLLVPAEQAWNDDGSLRRWLDRPQELLLTELGRASRIFPELVPALRTACPSGLELDADGAYRFLSGTAAVLDEAGFGVLLPSWWDRRRKLGLVLSAYTPVDGVVGKASKFGREQLVEFRWELAVGDDPLSEEEIAALTETKSPLIRLRGQWVALDTEQLRRGLEFLSVSQPAARPPPRSSRWPPATPTTWTPRSRSPPYAPTAGSGTCSPGPPRRRCSRWTRPTDSPRRCVPTSSAVWRGWRFCPRSVWAAAWHRHRPRAITGLLLPRLRGPMQAPGRHLLLAGRVLRRGSVRHPGVAWPRAGGSAGQPGRCPRRRSGTGRRPRRTSGPAAHRLPRPLLRPAGRHQCPQPAGNPIDGIARPAARHRTQRPRTAADRAPATRLSRPDAPSQQRGRLIPAHPFESAEVTVVGHDAGAMLDGKRGQMRVVDQVGTGSHVRQHSRQDIGVPDGRIHQDGAGCG